MSRPGVENAGTIPVLNAEDALEAPDLTRNIERREVRKAVPADATEAAWLKMFSQEPRHVDDIRIEIGLPKGKVSVAPAMMEVMARVRPAGGRNYGSVREEAAKYPAEEE